MIGLLLFILLCYTTNVHNNCFPRNNWSVERRTLYYPKLNKIANILGTKLQKQFKYVQSEVVICPDLRKEPFNLANEGISGSTRLLDIGSLNNIIPHPRFNKSYSLIDMISIAELNSAFAFGAGAGPYKQLGYNSEGFYNFNVQNCTLDNHSASIKLTNLANGTHGSAVLKLNNSHTDVGFHGTLFASKGEPGKVIRLSLKHRIKETFVLGTTIRHILYKHFGLHKPIALGLVGIFKSGIASTMIMPDFYEKTVPKIWNWVHKFNASAPLIMVGTITTNIKGLDLYVPHVHFCNEEQGGHFVTDLTPKEAQYEIYLNLAEYIYAVDKISTN